MKLAVAYPWSNPFAYTEFMDSVLALGIPAGYEVRWFRGGGWCNSRRRTDACEKALAWGADFILQIDADQVYAPDVLLQFTKHMENGLDMVAAMVPQRGYTEGSGMRPFQRLAWKSEDGATLVPVDVEDGELQKCFLPTCAALICRAKDVARLKRPWFRDQYNELTWEREFAEDLHFVIHMQKELGLEAWVDTTIQVKHLHTFKIDETFSGRFADWEQPDRGEPGLCRYGIRNLKYYRLGKPVGKPVLK